MAFEKKIDAKLILSIVAAGIMSFSGVVVETAMNVTFPTLMEEFSVGTSTVQWITTGYLLVLALVIPASSYLKRRFPMKALFIEANLLFLAGTVLAWAAPAFSMLLLGRIIQGVGTGIALPLMFNIVLEQVPEKKLGLMMGVASLITAVAPAVGPSFGGMIVQHFGWRMIFAALLPLLVLSFIFGVTSIRQVTPVQKVPFQWLDYLLLACGFSCFIFALSNASGAGWASAEVVGLFMASLLALGLFCFRSLRAAQPLLRVQVLGCGPFALHVLAIVLVQLICLGLGFLIPNYAQLVSGMNAFAAGCLLLPGCLLGAALAPVSGRILDRFGARKPILLGNVAIVAAAICFGLFAKTLTAPLIIAIYICFAFGQGCTMGNSMTNGLRQLPAEWNADGNAVINTLQQLAGAVGTAVVSTMVASAQARMEGDFVLGTMLGSQSAFLLLAVLALGVLASSLGAFYLANRQRSLRPTAKMQEES